MYSILKLLNLCNVDVSRCYGLKKLVLDGVCGLLYWGQCFYPTNWNNDLLRNRAVIFRYDDLLHQCQFFSWSSYINSNRNLLQMLKRCCSILSYNCMLSHFVSYFLRDCRNRDTPLFVQNEKIQRMLITFRTYGLMEWLLNCWILTYSRRNEHRQRVAIPIACWT